MLELENIAEVLEWYTRATQNRMPHGLWVQVPPSAPEYLYFLSIFFG
ncbi:MAG: hypothetical protein RI945_152 [Candidatus Parcubacteria bacterium]